MMVFQVIELRPEPVETDVQPARIIGAAIHPFGHAVIAEYGDPLAVQPGRYPRQSRIMKQCEDSLLQRIKWTGLTGLTRIEE
jgi:hypothetical protein